MRATSYAIMQFGFLGEPLALMKIFVPTTTLVGTFLFFIGSSAPALGEIYKWTDPQGHLHFSNTPTGKAEAVDDALPPASSFVAPPEPTPAPTVSSIPSSDASSPPQPTAPVPSADSEPLNEEPTVESETVPTPAGLPPASADVPGISDLADPADLADLPGISDPAELSQEESATAE